MNVIERKKKRHDKIKLTEKKKKMKNNNPKRKNEAADGLQRKLYLHFSARCI